MILLRHQFGLVHIDTGDDGLVQLGSLLRALRAVLSMYLDFQIDRRIWLVPRVVGRDTVGIGILGIGFDVGITRGTLDRWSIGFSCIKRVVTKSVKVYKDVGQFASIQTIQNLKFNTEKVLLLLPALGARVPLLLALQLLLADVLVGLLQALGRVVDAVERMIDGFDGAEKEDNSGAVGHPYVQRRWEVLKLFIYLFIYSLISKRRGQIQ